MRDCFREPSGVGRGVKGSRLFRVEVRPDGGGVVHVVRGEGGKLRG
jgi:hypothetical protein